METVVDGVADPGERKGNGKAPLQPERLGRWLSAWRSPRSDCRDYVHGNRMGGCPRVKERAIRGTGLALSFYYRPRLAPERVHRVL